MKRSVVSALIAVVAVIALAGSSFAAFTTGIQNGGFQGSTTFGYQQLNVGSTALSPWVVEAPVDWINTYYDSGDGDGYSLDMNASPSQGSVSQTFGTTANNTYLVAFKLAGNPTIHSLCPAAVKTLDVTADAVGASVENYSFDTTTTSAHDMGWTDEGYTFVATSGSTKVTFTSTTVGNCGPALDAVTVTETAVATADNCKNDGWQSMFDLNGWPFKNQGDCVSYYATDGRNLAAPSTDNHGALVSAAAQTDASALGAFPNRGAFVSCVARMTSDTTLKPLTLNEYLDTGKTLLDLPSVAAETCGYGDTTPTDQATSDAAKAKGQDKAANGKAKGQDKAANGKAKGQAKAAAAKSKHQH